MAKVRYRTTIAADEPEESGSGRFEPGDFFRIPIALFLIAFAGYGVWFAWLTTMGERLSQTGWKLSSGKSDPIVGQQMIETGMKLTPWDPNMQDRYTSLKLDLETRKIDAKRFREVNAGELVRIDGMIEKLEMFSSLPDQLILRRASLATKLYQFSKAVGNTAEASKWKLKILPPYLEFRAMRRMPQGSGGLPPFFGVGIWAALEAGRPDDGLLMWRDYRTAHPELSFKETAAALRGIESELRFGFDPNAALDLLTLRLEKPDDKDARNTWNNWLTSFASDPAIKIIDGQMPR